MGSPGSNAAATRGARLAEHAEARAGIHTGPLLPTRTACQTPKLGAKSQGFCARNPLREVAAAGEPGWAGKWVNLLRGPSLGMPAVLSGSPEGQRRGQR